MARLSQAKLALVLWTSISLFCAAALGAAGGPQPASADPISVIPADSLFCVRINNLMGTMGKIDQFLTGVSPIGVSMIVPAQLAKFLGSTEPKGINMSGSFAIFGPLPGGDTPNLKRIAVLVPISDYKQFTGGNPNVVPPDAQGIATIGKEQPMFVATDVSGFALVTPSNNRQALIETKKLIVGAGATALAKRLSPDELKRAQESPVWAYANIQTISKVYGPTIQAKLQEFKKMMEQMQPQGQPGQAAAGMDMNIAMVNTLMQELQSVSLILDPSTAAIRAGFVATAMPNTQMAKVLQAAAGAPDKKFMQYLENGAIVNITMSIDPATWNTINNFYFDMIAKSAGKSASSEEVAKLKKWSADAVNALTGTVAGSFSAEPKSKPPFRLQYVAGMKDPQAFYRILEQAPAMTGSGLFADLMKQSGVAIKFELKRKAETYKDVPIDVVRVGINLTDPNSQQGKMLASVLGQGIEARLAVVNNLLVYAVAGDPVAGIHKLIDQVKSGSTQSAPSEVQAAMQLIPGSEKANFFMTYNLLRLFQMIAAFMPMPMPQTAVQSESSIAIAGRMAGGNLGIDLALPKQHLMEIMSVFMQMQQQKMQEQQPAPAVPPQQGAKAKTDGWGVAGAGSVFSPQTVTEERGTAVSAIPSQFLGAWVAPDGSDYEVKRVVIGKDEVLYGPTRIKAGECRTTDDGATLVFKIRMVNPDIATSAGPYVDRVDVRLTVSGEKLTAQSGGRMEQSMGDGWVPVVPTKVRTYSREPSSPRRQ